LAIRAVVARQFSLFTIVRSYFERLPTGLSTSSPMGAQNIRAVLTGAGLFGGGRNLDAYHGFLLPPA